MPVDLGRVSLIGKGDYSPTAQYERLDVVRYNGVVYLVLKDVKGVTPAAGANYMKLVEDGADGAPGAQGPAGTNGTDGAQGPAGPGVPVGGTDGQVLTKDGVENYKTKWADPPSSSGGGVGQSMAGQTVEPVQGETVVAGEGAEIFNDCRERTFSIYYEPTQRTGNVASGQYSHAEGNTTTASGNDSHAEGTFTTSSGEFSHAEGFYATAIGEASHAEGTTTLASGGYSHAEGRGTEASGGISHAEGVFSEATGTYSHAEGISTKATGNYGAHAQNYGTIAAGEGQTAMGKYNIESTLKSDKLLIGNGSHVGYRSNCFRVTDTGVFAAGNYNASGADYAEMFEWADGNPEKQDRVGRFVTLDGAKIRLAGPQDDYIIGIVSGDPSVVGDVHDDQWQGMYLHDIFGRPLWEDVEVPDVKGKDGSVIIPAHTEHRQKLNPDYDSSQPYQPRSERPEWDAIGMLGKLVALDDGSCTVNGWCTVGAGGIAVKSEGRTRYRVMERLDDTHIRIMIL